jgi:hypothetical protein
MRRPIAATYAAIGLVLIWSHLAQLGRGYCCDEIATVTSYVEHGPRTILAGSYLPNNHQLFSLVAWATTALVSESPLALRLWSAIPFLLGVLVVTVWLHRRCGAVSGILFLLLATASPLLLDITRMARGYGLAFLAMAVLVVCALEAERRGETRAIVGFTIAGLVGSLTLPHFFLAFAATAAVLLIRAELRFRVLVGIAASLAVVLAWYAPHLDDIASTSLDEYGLRIPTRWLLTAPLDQTIVPAMTLLDDSFVRPSPASLAWAVAFAVLIGSSPLLRHRLPALILCSGVLATVTAFWITGTNVVPRFFSFLLVPLFILVATGSASIVARARTGQARLRAALVGVTFATIVLLAIPYMRDVPRLPRDSGSEAALTIRRVVPSSTPVFAHMAYPHDLSFHLGRSVRPVWSPSEAIQVCRADGLAVYVHQPYLVPAANVPCTRRRGARRHHFEHYARGQGIDVWIIPAA